VRKVENPNTVTLSQVQQSIEDISASKTDCEVNTISNELGITREIKDV